MRAQLDHDDFDAVAAFGPDDVERILETPGMIRSRRKIEAIINNARCFRRVRAEFGSFDAYLWGFSDGKTILYNKHADGWIPVSNGLSARVAADLRKRGFKYLGPTTVYSHLHQRPRTRLPALRGGERPGPYNREAPLPREGRPVLRVGQKGTGSF